jgi:hypothetical protein
MNKYDLKKGVYFMPINNQDKIKLLHDLLEDHQLDCCGTTSECEQIARLALSLIENGQLNYEANEMLSQIKEYSMSGSSHPELEAHIKNNQHYLTSWVSSLDQLT